MIPLNQRQMSPEALIASFALWVALFCNCSFFTTVLDAYPMGPGNIGFFLALALLLVALTVLVLAPFAIGRALKPLLAILLFVTSVTAYFMDSYNVIISAELIESALQTDSSESMGLLNLKLLLYLGAFGLLPAALLYKVRIRPRTLRAGLLSRMKLVAAASLMIIVLLALFNSAFASFFREHKSIRFYTNPLTPVYTAISYVHGELAGRDSVPYQQIGLDARQKPAVGKRRLLVLVVGETAREDHFALNGYGRETNPRLIQRNVFSFDNVWSCGTATAVSVPCMFSALDRKHYAAQQAKNTDNVLDILQRAGVNVAWLDNNSDSKGVALRIPYTSYRSSQVNSKCDSECRDEGMLAGIKGYVSTHSSGDILVVLHQMGSHGPQYAKRYPKEFEHFSPSCHSNLLDDCSESEINNAYDNSIRYTDYFLSRVIDYLQGEAAGFSSAMLYLSDHGESLGERGIYLHGFPYALAPDEQKHVPMVMWFGSEHSRELGKLADLTFTHREFSQDNLFHTLLGLMAVKTSVYQPGLDIFADG